MRLVVSFLAGCLISAPLCALEVVGNTIVLDDADIANCMAEGGRAFVTRADVELIIAKRVEQALVACRNRL